MLLTVCVNAANSFTNNFFFSFFPFTLMHRINRNYFLCHIFDIFVKCVKYLRFGNKSEDPIRSITFNRLLVNRIIRQTQSAGNPLAKFNEICEKKFSRSQSRKISSSRAIKTTNRSDQWESLSFHSRRKVFDRQIKINHFSPFSQPTQSCFNTFVGSLSSNLFICWFFKHPGSLRISFWGNP